MYGTEFRKIMNRKITVIFGLVILLFSWLYFHMSVIGSDVNIEDGRILLRGEAIKRNREITQQYEGTLTIDKVNDIFARYGFPPAYNAADLHIDYQNGTVDQGYYDNFCNQFVAQHFYWVENQEEGYTAQEADMVSRYLNPELHFAYFGGWDWFWDQFLMLFILVCVWVIIAVAPVFAEEYSLKTADILLTADRGRGRLYWTKVGAALGSASLTYWVVSLMLVLMNAWAYGWDALKVSTLFTSVINWYNKLPLWISVLSILLCGWAAVLALTMGVLGISSVCRNSFNAVLWSLAMYLVPPAVYFIFLAQLKPTLLVYLFRKLTCSLPFLYPAFFQEMPIYSRMLQSCILFAFALLMILFGCRRYRRHQVG